MFIDFFYELKKSRIPVSITEFMTLIKALELGLENCNLENFYFLARSLLVKDIIYYDEYDRIFLKYFQGLDIPISIRDEILKWLEDPKRLNLTKEQLEQLKKLGLDELLKMFEERLKEQKERHDGGNRWIGTGGTSPFGNYGAHPTGISFSSTHGAGTAVKIAMQRYYRNYRNDIRLDIRQIQMALKKLRRFKRVGIEDELDLDGTIDKTCKNGGELEICMQPPRKNRIKVLLMMDAGGSMDPYIDIVNRLFSAAHSLRFFKDFKYYYFHNCVYQISYKDMNQDETIYTSDILRKCDEDYKLIMVGDASMAHSELMCSGGSLYYTDTDGTAGIVWLNRLRQHFKKSVWLNPMNENVWGGYTVKVIRTIFPMFPLTLEGIENAVKNLV
ncbi:MAG: vWA domain-containing protein [Candidatus Helarchaeota archaeon]